MMSAVLGSRMQEIRHDTLAPARIFPAPSSQWRWYSATDQNDRSISNVSSKSSIVMRPWSYLPQLTLQSVATTVSAAGRLSPRSSRHASSSSASVVALGGAAVTPLENYGVGVSSRSH